MFGFEFSDKKLSKPFPEYDLAKAIPPESIERIVPLVWQEHCLECGMPLCYKTCIRYQKRSDGRCRLFKNGIERKKNPHAILGQNAIIEMREWGKLQTFFFPAVYSYKTAKAINSLYVVLAKLAQIAKKGMRRRFFYYVKEYCSRKIGYGKKHGDLPEFFIFELFNDKVPYSISLECHAGDTVLYRTRLDVKPGYNRFIIPTKDFNFKPDKVCSLLIFSSEGKEVNLNIISLEMVDFKEKDREKIIRSTEKKVKMVVWDLDNTLWKGILSEDGADGIILNHEMVSIIKELDAKGIINSIASKNDSDTVLPVLKQFGIEEYFISPMINWNPKSENIKELARIIDLNTDTFVFVDDTENELKEVLTNCSGIRVCGVEHIAKFVQGAAFDVPITQESKSRRKMYQEASLRNRSAKRFENSIDDFLRDCNMIMHIAKPSKDEIERCFELIQRTNQLNISGERLTREELGELLASEKHDCYRIKVDDKYGNYGLVGFAVFEKQDQDSIVLKHFVFSCRAARKKLEQFFFEMILDQYKKQGYKTLSLVCKKTERNALMQSVLMESGLFEKKNESHDSFLLTASIDTDHIKSGIATLRQD